MAGVLVDTGPLVALLDRSDAYHTICRQTLRGIGDQLITAWPVVTEAMYLLRGYLPAQRALWEMLETGALEISMLEKDDCARMRDLMWKYRDLPMDLADAALVRIAERERLRRVFTLDRRDFQIYRPSRIGRFAVLPS